LRNLAVGIGCRKGVSFPEIEREMIKLFHKVHLPVAAIRYLCTIEAKSKESGLREFADSKNIPLLFYGVEELNKVAMQSPESAYARRIFHVQGVAEPAAIVGAKGGELLVKKVKLSRMTLAIAQFSIVELIKEYNATKQAC
jgi:cobalt-precorrin 5A hydrolase